MGLGNGAVASIVLVGKFIVNIIQKTALLAIRRDHLKVFKYWAKKGILLVGTYRGIDI